MSRNVDVFRLLVTGNNKGLLAKGKKLTDLEVGQIGLFDASSHLSADATKLPKEYYFAVGLDNDGDGKIDDVAKSTGNFIQGENTFYYSHAPYSEGEPMKAVLKDFTAKCNHEYGLRIVYTNEQILRAFGYTPFVKTYIIKNECCSECSEPCLESDSVEVAKKLIALISNDKDKLVKVKAIARKNIANKNGVTVNKGEEVTAENLDKLIEYNKKQTSATAFEHVDIEFETLPLAKTQFGDYNYNYFNQRETTIEISKPVGFKCDGTIEITQEAKYEQGSGYDLYELDFVQKGWTVSPYRTSAFNNMFFNPATVVDKKGKYDIFVLAYDEESTAGFGGNFRFAESTIVAVPKDDATTIGALKPLFEKLKG